MGRRALRRIDPSLDLSNHLLTLDDLPAPFSLKRLFQRPAPLEIEVGSGKGLFLASASGDHPERNFVGCEVARKYARFAAAKLAKAGRTNAVMINGDALRLFAEILPAEIASAVHVYFPDPWWKKRHRRRRVMNERFAADIERVLKPGGYLHFWSDVEEYFQVTVEMLQQSTALQGPFDVPEKPAEHDLDYRTHFERRMRLHDVPVYRCIFQR